jgi:hypothetical protein
VFYDLDDEVERINGDHNFETVDKKRAVWLQARRNYAEKTNQHLKNSESVVVVGPFYTQDELVTFLTHVEENTPVYLFTLNNPLEVRMQRNRDRQWSNDEDMLKAQQEQIEKLEEKYGYHFDNNRSIDYSVSFLIDLINKREGIIDRPGLI